MQAFAILYSVLMEMFCLPHSMLAMEARLTSVMEASSICFSPLLSLACLILAAMEPYNILSGVFTSFLITTGFIRVNLYGSFKMLNFNLDQFS